MRLWNYLHHHVLVSQTLHRIRQRLNYERAYPTPLMGRTNHYACEKKTDCTISDDAAESNNLLLFNGTDAKERELAKAISTAGSSCSRKPTDAIPTRTPQRSVFCERSRWPS